MIACSIRSAEETVFMFFHFNAHSSPWRAPVVAAKWSNRLNTGPNFVAVANNCFTWPTSGGVTSLRNILGRLTKLAGFSRTHFHRTP
jgi:hypothetical protein